jgi:hypothetical protein
LQLAVSSTNKLYIWGASPQVLRLQAQAQKKAKLQQQQQSSSGTSRVTPSSPSRPVTAQVHSALDVNSELSSPLLGSPNLTAAAKPEYLPINIHKDDHRNLKPVLSSCDSVLPSVDISCSLSSDVVKTQGFSFEANVNIKDAIPSRSELSSPVLSSNADCLNNTSSLSDFAMKTSRCHKFLSENSSNKSEISNKEHVNNQKQSSQNSNELPVTNGERIYEVKVAHSEKNMQQSESSFVCLNEKQEEFQSSYEPDKTSSNKNSLQPFTFLSQDSPGSSACPGSSLVASDIESRENSNVGAVPKDLQFRSCSFASKRKDQNLDLKVCFFLPVLKYILTITTMDFCIVSLK